MKNIGIIGYGKLGQFLANYFCTHPEYSKGINVSCVWNRSPIIPEKIPAGVSVLSDLESIRDFDLDLIVEVAHPDIMTEWGFKFLSISNVLIGSPTVFCDKNFENEFIASAHKHSNKTFCSKGALSGIFDLMMLSDQKVLQNLSIQMKKSPESIKLTQALNLNEMDREVSLFKGPVRELAKIAPNNVNTMVVAALASGLGLDRTHGELIAVPHISYHEVSWKAEAKIKDSSIPFILENRKVNPSKQGAVTGTFTYMSFIDSILRALKSRDIGFQFC